MLLHVSIPPPSIMQVSDTMMSIATLTGESLERMTSLEHAPKIVATLVGKGGDFSNEDGQMDGVPVMPQVGAVEHWGRGGRVLDGGEGFLGVIFAALALCVSASRGSAGHAGGVADVITLQMWYGPLLSCGTASRCCHC